MISPRTYPQTPFVRRNVLHLLDRGFHIDLIHVAPYTAVEWTDEHERLRRHPVAVKHRRSRASSYVIEYLSFFINALWIVLRLSLSNRYLSVHVDNPPDFVVFAALPAKLRGAHVLLNIADPMPDLTAARLEVSDRHPVIRLARFLERISAWFADAVTVPNEVPCRQLVVGRGVPAMKVSVLPNTLNAAKRPPTPKAGPPVAVCVSTLLERYGVQTAIYATDLLRDRWPDLTLRIIGEGEYGAELARLASRLGLDGRVEFLGFVPWPDAMEEVRRCHAGIVSVLPERYGLLMTPTKLLDYVQQGVPTISSRLPGVTAYFPDDSVRYYEGGDAADLARQLDAVLRDPLAALEMAKRAQAALEVIGWERTAADYLACLRLSGSADGVPLFAEPGDSSAVAQRVVK
jgi:glycosyltransferase involved in cell wall biosynthesis